MHQFRLYLHRCSDPWIPQAQRPVVEHRVQRRREFLLVDLDRRDGLRPADHRDATRLNFCPKRRPVVQPNGPLYFYDVLVIQAAHLLVQHALHQSLPVADQHEPHAAQIADPVDPALDDYLLARVKGDFCGEYSPHSYDLLSFR